MTDQHRQKLQNLDRRRSISPFVRLTKWTRNCNTDNTKQSKKENEQSKNRAKMRGWYLSKADANMYELLVYRNELRTTQ